MQNRTERIILYTSNFCGHASRVQNFLAKYKIPLKLVNIDAEPAAREELIELNNGFASVPTVVFPDGTHLTEPSIGVLRTKLELKDEDTVIERLSRVRRS